jgi:hypothetical protein
VTAASNAAANPGTWVGFEDVSEFVLVEEAAPDWFEDVFVSDASVCCFGDSALLASPASTTDPLGTYAAGLIVAVDDVASTATIVDEAALLSVGFFEAAGLYNPECAGGVIGEAGVVEALGAKFVVRD